MEDQAEVLVARGDPVRPLIIEEPPLLFDARDPIPPSPPHFAMDAIPSLAISCQSWWCRCCLVGCGLPLRLPQPRTSIGNNPVPVDAFWSITVYNTDGYIEKNDRDAYGFNNITAKANKDGSITIHFGGCEDDRINCLPISEGWNYAARMYQPREEILNGSWTFPVPVPVK